MPSNERGKGELRAKISLDGTIFPPSAVRSTLCVVRTDYASPAADDSIVKMIF